MADVRLSNIIDIEVFQDLPAQNSTVLTDFVASGIITRDAAFDAVADAPGTKGFMPFWTDLGDVEPNYGNDNPATQATPLNVSQDELIIRKTHLNQGWSAMDLAREIQTGTDAMQHIRNRIDSYWDRHLTNRLVNTALGVLADNIANDSSDMLFAAHTETGLSATDANRFTRTGFVSALMTSGDAFKHIQAIGVHSSVYKQMILNDDIDFIPDSNGTDKIPFYLDKRVIIDDSLPVRAGNTNGLVSTAILFGAGAFGVGVGEVDVPFEVDRDPRAGNGNGQEELWSRKKWIIQPQGYDFTSDTLTGAASSAPANPRSTDAGKSATLADLLLADNWDRKYDRKNIPLSFLTVNV